MEQNFRQKEEPEENGACFVRLVKKYQDFDEITPAMLYEFIDRIVVHEAEGGRGTERTQRIDIYFNFIGQFPVPISQEELEQERKIQLEKQERKEEEKREKKRENARKWAQKRKEERARIKAAAEAGDEDAKKQYEEILAKEKERREQEADFVSCVVFGKGAEFAQKYLRKGMKVAVIGRINIGSYKDKDGKTVYTTDVIVEEHEFADSPKAKNDTETGTDTGKESATTDKDGFMNVPEGEEFPFE